MIGESAQLQEVSRKDTESMPGAQPSPAPDSSRQTHTTAPTRFVEANGIRFAYRRFGNPTGTPVVLLQQETVAGMARDAASRGGEHMDGLAADVAPLFAKVYEPQGLMWLPIFFSPSDASQAAGRRFLDRIRARTEDRDVPVSQATVAAHAAAARRSWGGAARGDFSYLKRIAQPTLVVNGSNDIVVPTVNSYVLQQNLPDAELILFPDSNHGSHFQFTDLFNRYATEFLDRAARNVGDRARGLPAGERGIAVS